MHGVPHTEAGTRSGETGMHGATVGGVNTRRRGRPGRRDAQCSTAVLRMRWLAGFRVTADDAAAGSGSAGRPVAVIILPAAIPRYGVY